MKCKNMAQARVITNFFENRKAKQEAEGSKTRASNAYISNTSPQLAPLENTGKQAFL